MPQLFHVQRVLFGVHGFVVLVLTRRALTRALNMLALATVAISETATAQAPTVSGVVFLRMQDGGVSRGAGVPVRVASPDSSFSALAAEACESLRSKALAAAMAEPVPRSSAELRVRERIVDRRLTDYRRWLADSLASLLGRWTYDSTHSDVDGRFSLTLRSGIGSVAWTSFTIGEQRYLLWRSVESGKSADLSNPSELASRMDCGPQL